jgi:hypothetical protein
MSQALRARKIARRAAYKVQKRRAAHQGGVNSIPSLSALEANWRLWLRIRPPTYVNAGGSQAIPGHLRSVLGSCVWKTSNASNACASTPSASKSTPQKRCTKPRH